jgi:hypothetical protein
MKNFSSNIFASTHLSFGANNVICSNVEGGDGVVE